VVAGRRKREERESEFRVQQIQIEKMQMQIQEHDGRNAALSREDASKSSLLVCQFQDSNFASRFAKEYLENPKKRAAWASFKTTARLWAGAFTQETSVGFVLTAIHSILVGEFFIPRGCWTGNFSTAIVEAHNGKGLISEGEMKQLINLAYLINTYARHIPRVESIPGPSRSDEQWRWKNGKNRDHGLTSEWRTYSDIYDQFQKKNQLQIAGPIEPGFE